MSSQSASFGRALRQYRVAIGWSQEVLAERAHVSARTVRAIERGDGASPRPATLGQLFDALELDDRARLELAELLDGSGSERFPHAFVDGDGPAETLRRLRAERGLTQRTLAVNASLSVGTISALERGQSGAALPDTAHRLGVAAGLDGVELASFIAAMTGQRSELASLRRLIGRDDEVMRVRSALDSDRIATIVGAGGVGKTALALAVAESHDGAARVVMLADVAAGTRLLDAIATVVGADDRAACASILAACDLVVLDNVEHLSEVQTDLTEVAGQLDATRLLVTSRLPIDAVASIRLEALRPAAAIELLRQRVREQEGAAAWHRNELVGEICEAVGRLPLALELVAGWASLLSPTETLARLFEPLALLAQPAVSSAMLPERQRDIRSVVHWTLELLTEKAHEFALELTVHPAPFTYELADEMHGDVGNLAASLRQLVSAGLVVRHDELDPYRFVVPVVIRETLAELFHDELRRRTLLDRLASAMVRLSDRTDAELLGDDQAAWLDRLDAERAHHELARRHLAATRSPDAVRLAGGLWRYWQLRGLYGVGAGEIRASLSGIDAGASGESFARYGLAVLEYLRGEHGEARQQARRAHDGFEQATDRHGVVCARSLLGMIAQHEGRSADAEQWYRSGLEQAGRSRPDRDHATLLANYASLLGQEGRFAEAVAMGEEAAAVHEALGDERGAAVAIGNLAIWTLATGAVDRARHLGADAHATFSRLGDPHGLVESELVLAEIDVHLGDVEGAIESLARVDRLLEDLEDPWAESVSHALWAMVELLRGDPERAVRRARTAVRLGESVEYGYALVRAHLADAASRLVLGEDARARSSAVQSIGHARGGHPICVAIASAVVGVALSRDRPADRDPILELVEPASAFVDAATGPRPRVFDVVLHRLPTDPSTIGAGRSLPPPTVDALRNATIDIAAAVVRTRRRADLKTTSGGGKSA